MSKEYKEVNGQPDVLQTIDQARKSDRKLHNISQIRRWKKNERSIDSSIPSNGATQAVFIGENDGEHDAITNESRVWEPTTHTAEEDWNYEMNRDISQVGYPASWGPRTDLMDIYRIYRKSDTATSSK